VCLYCAEEKTAFVGDLIFAGGGVGRTDLPMGSAPQLYNSIEKFLQTVAPETTLYPGHGPSTTAGEEKMMLL
jgi:glyoxylase-like metal-dependent hydrolase (beta-lactamase superfamily II)